VTIFLLIAVLIFGEEINGARRWLTIGPIDIQPAEFAKIVLIIYLSGWLSKTDYVYKNIKSALKEVLIKNLVSFLLFLES
jgi:cell division protein FtsW